MRAWFFLFFVSTSILMHWNVLLICCHSLVAPTHFTNDGCVCSSTHFCLYLFMSCMFDFLSEFVTANVGNFVD